MQVNRILVCGIVGGVALLAMTGISAEETRKPLLKRNSGNPGTVKRDVSLLKFIMNQRNRQYVRVPHKVLAFYYTWYGTPKRNGAWIHWNKVDPAHHDISASTHYPALGAYDSHDPDLLDKHLRMAKRYGIDGFIATWWGQGSYSDKAVLRLLDRAEKQGIDISLYWETVPGEGASQIRRAVNDLVLILGRYAEHKAFLRVNGKPVVFVYGRVMNQVPLAAWPEIILRARQESGKDFLLIADGYREGFARIFDGVHTYNIAGACRNKSVEEIRALAHTSFPGAVTLARQHGRISCITIIPGYDDTKIRKPGLRVERFGGRTYQALWEEAIQAAPDWVLITSFNEWHEGSELEPSLEYGDLYMKLTGQYAPRFKKLPFGIAGTAASVGGGVPAELSRELRTLYADITIGVLPDFSSEAVFWLADAGLKLREFTWADVVDPGVLNPRALPVLLYAGGEKYVQSFEKKGDVDRALVRYLQRGGFLVVIPSQPYPFYYNQDGEAVAAAGRFGIPINGSGAFERRDVSPDALVKGWETPPAGRELRFKLDFGGELPASVAFPGSGDLRWRPCTRRGVAQGDRYMPLATLIDGTGKEYGDGVALIEYNTPPLAGGRALYVWMRMPDILNRDRFFHALFKQVALRLRRPE